MNFRKSMVLGLFSWMGVTSADAGVDDYYAQMEQAAQWAPATTQVAREGDRPDLMERLSELRKLSPSAWAIYRQLRPAYQAEVRDAILRGDDLYSVIEMIFIRNG